MKCDYDLCIYQKDNKCMLDEISINSLGQCYACIIAIPDDSTLNKLKEEMRTRLL